MIRVLLLALVVASTSACSFPRCTKDQKACSHSSQFSGQIDITCSIGSASLPVDPSYYSNNNWRDSRHRILQNKDWVAPAGPPMVDSCGCSLSLSQFWMLAGDLLKWKKNATTLRNNHNIRFSIFQIRHSGHLLSSMAERLGTLYVGVCFLFLFLTCESERKLVL